MKTKPNNNGFVLIVALLILIVLTIIGIAATTTTVFELKIAANDKTHKRALYQAEAGAVLSTEVLEQNINCLTGFNKTGTVGVEVADLETTIRVWSRTTNKRNGLAMYLDPLPGTTDNLCTPKDPNSPNISYPLGNINSMTELTDVFVGGKTAMLPGGSLAAAAGYERKGKSAAHGGTIRLYDIISRHRGLNSSQATVLFGWRHLIGEESSCRY